MERFQFKVADQTSKLCASPEYIQDVVCSKNNFSVVTNKGKLYVFDRESRSKVGEYDLDGNTKATKLGITYHENMMYLVGTKSGKIIVYDQRTKKTARRLRRHFKSVTSLTTISSQPNIFFSCGLDWKVVVWSIIVKNDGVVSAQHTKELTTHQAPVRSLCHFKNEKVVVSGGDSAKLLIHDSSTGSILEEIRHSYKTISTMYNIPPPIDRPESGSLLAVLTKSLQCGVYNEKFERVKLIDLNAILKTKPSSKLNINISDFYILRKPLSDGDGKEDFYSFFSSYSNEGIFAIHTSGEENEKIKSKQMIRISKKIIKLRLDFIYGCLWTFNEDGTISILNSNLFPSPLPKEKKTEKEPSSPPQPEPSLPEPKKVKEEPTISKAPSPETPKQVEEKEKEEEEEENTKPEPKTASPKPKPKQKPKPKPKQTKPVVEGSEEFKKVVKKYEKEEVEKSKFIELEKQVVMKKISTQQPHSSSNPGKNSKKLTDKKEGLSFLNSLLLQNDKKEPKKKSEVTKQLNEKDDDKNHHHHQNESEKPLFPSNGFVNLQNEYASVRNWIGLIEQKHQRQSDSTTREIRFLKKQNEYLKTQILQLNEKSASKKEEEDQDDTNEAERLKDENIEMRSVISFLESEMQVKNSALESKNKKIEELEKMNGFLISRNYSMTMSEREDKAEHVKLKTRYETIEKKYSSARNLKNEMEKYLKQIKISNVKLKKCIKSVDTNLEEFISAVQKAHSASSRSSGNFIQAKLPQYFEKILNCVKIISEMKRNIVFTDV